MINAAADPITPVGDLQLRHDLEFLADRGLISTPVTTWPMSWAELASAVDSIDREQVRTLTTATIIERLESRVGRQITWGMAELYGEVAVSDNRTRLHTFEQPARGSVEVTGVIEYTGRSFAGKLQLSALSDTDDDKNFRLDGSYIGLIWNNLAITFGAQDQWWGPGHAGSLILSTNARPVPGVALQRNLSSPFRSRYLRWLGPWTFKMFAGKLESNREVSSPYLLGARATIKPTRRLELGVSRTAQWGGDGRPEDFDSLIDLVIGRDNVGDGVSRANEPGNQLAGFDGRYSMQFFQIPLTIYGQLIGEDEAGGFPSRYLGQFGLSTSLPLRWRDSSLRLNLEYSDTTCQFYESSKRFNCAYNSAIYRTGYRYRGASIGHSTDNDSQQFAVLATLNERDSKSWALAWRGGELNRGGPDDPTNTLTPSRVDYYEIDVSHSRPLIGGKLDIGVGFQDWDRLAAGRNDSDLRVSLRWSSRLP